MKKGIALIILIAVTITACKKEEQQREFIRPVKAMQIKTALDALGKGFPAVSKETSEANLAFRISGPLTKLNVEEGQSVRKSQLIAEVDPRDFEVDLLAKSRRYIQAKAELDRWAELLKRQSVSQNDYDLKLAAYYEAESAFQAAENALTDTKIYAPYTAFVGKKFVENFEEIRAGQNIISLINISVIEVKTYIPENLAIQFFNFAGYEVEFEVYPGKVFDATLKEIEKSPEPEGFPLTLYLDHKNVRGSGNIITPGMTCKVNIKLKDEIKGTTSESIIIVPLSAVIEKENATNPSVWVFDIDNSIVSKREVKIGSLVSNNSIQIIDGLDSDEWIVTAGAHRLTEGQKVKQLSERL